VSWSSSRDLGVGVSPERWPWPGHEGLGFLPLLGAFAAGSVASQALRRRPLVRIAFNSGQVLAAATAALAVLQTVLRGWLRARQDRQRIDALEVGICSATPANDDRGVAASHRRRAVALRTRQRRSVGWTIR
jgi:hypothetical protein